MCQFLKLGIMANPRPIGVSMLVLQI